MKVHIELESGRREVNDPPDGVKFVEVHGSCPACAATGDAFRAIGIMSEQHRGHDTITAPAAALCCGTRIGRMVVAFDTFFGLEEDEAIGLRARVYR